MDSRRACRVSATFSKCGRYRYALHRDARLGGEGDVLFVMLNPSTADATKNDPTTRRCIGFAQRWGFARLVIANLYAYRATVPVQLRQVEDPVGPDNDEWIERLAQNAAEVIVAWGAFADASEDRIADVVRLIERTRVPRCLGVTQSGRPRHPLYVRYDQPRVALPCRVAA